MTSDLLHEPAMEKIKSSGVTSHMFDKALRSLATMADESNANKAATTITFVEDEEPVDARYLPSITLSVYQPNRDEGKAD